MTPIADTLGILTELDQASGRALARLFHPATLRDLERDQVVTRDNGTALLTDEGARLLNELEGYQPFRELNSSGMRS